MPADHRRSALLLLAAVGAGLIGWSGFILLLPAAMAFPAIWSKARTRMQAAIISAGYFLSASRGLPQGVATYYRTDLWPGLALWAVASASFIVVHSLLWTHRRGWRKPLHLLAACAIMAVPPFGISGWASPLTGAGVLFPDQGWAGLAFTAACLAVLTTGLRGTAAIILCAAWLWSGALGSDVKAPSDWRGVDLTMGSTLGRAADLMQQRDLLLKTRAVAAPAPRVVVLPEAALGFWTPTVEHVWHRALADGKITVLVGALMADETGYDNVVLAIDHQEVRLVYRQRMPVPIAMWQPWLTWWSRSGGAHAHLSQAAAIVSGRRVAVLICYEQLLVWPILQSMMDDPDLIVAIGNGWWTSGTSIVSVQRTAIRAWSRLFGKPVVFSFNT